MEENKSNKFTNILSGIGIIALLAGMVAFAIFANKNKEETVNDPWSELLVTEAPTPTTPPTVNNTEVVTSDTKEILTLFCEDIVELLECNNPRYMTIDTPGITSETIASMRTALGQSKVEIFFTYEVDYELTNTSNKGEYLIVFNLNTSKGPKRLYVYTWPTRVNNQYYIASVSFDIGDF